MKNVLIISPYFPPVNTADMQRVRMSLPYFKEYDWHAEVVAVDAKYTDLPQDGLLLESLPEDVTIHHIKALPKNWTSKIGFGSISYRCFWFLRKEVNKLLKSKKFDLIYFSTTQFQVCILGAYWKKRFHIPYVIDMQDPWHSDYYKDKPKAQQPPKYRFIYRLNKYLEAKAMKRVDGIISVSDNYIQNLKTRYARVNQIPAAVITFGAFGRDLDIALKHRESFKPLLDPEFRNIVYIGRGGMDMYNAIRPVFETFKQGLTNSPDVFNKLKFCFIGTSYAPEGQGAATILPLAAQYGVGEHVMEITTRIGYYHTLATLQQADALFILGSDDPNYTASKIYPYLLTKRPLLAIFNSESSAINILAEYGANWIYSYDKTDNIQSKIKSFLMQIIHGEMAEQLYNAEATSKYSAREMTKRQCDLFNLVLK